MSIKKYIDPYQMASAEQSVKGGLKSEQLTRISDLIVSNPNGNDVSVNLQFQINTSNNPNITGEIHSKLWLTCQRCLESFSIDFSTKVDVCVMASEEKARQLNSHQEYIVVADQTLFLHQLIEDEMLLAIPVVAYHDDSQACNSLLDTLDDDIAENSEAASDGNPFQVLQKLKASQSINN